MLMGQGLSQTLRPIPTGMAAKDFRVGFEGFDQCHVIPEKSPILVKVFRNESLTGAGAEPHENVEVHGCAKGVHYQTG